MCVPNTSAQTGMQARHPPASLNRQTNSNPVADCSFALPIRLNEMSQDTSEEGHQGLHPRAPAHARRGPADLACQPKLQANWRQFAARHTPHGAALHDFAGSKLYWFVLEMSPRPARGWRLKEGVMGAS